MKRKKRILLHHVFGLELRGDTVHRLLTLSRQEHKHPVTFLNEMVDIAETELDKWFVEFQKELAEQSGTGIIPNGLDKNSYFVDFCQGVSPAQRAAQELDDLSR